MSRQRSAGSGGTTGGAWLRWARRLAVLALFPFPAFGQTHVVIVSGLGGDKKYTESFAKLASTFAEAANKRFGIPESEVMWFGEESTSKKPYFKGQSTKANVERAMPGSVGSP